ncbi:glycosyltransferase family 87 protein [Thermoflexus sp.]|uniref:glycosyltransferase family 87 protein n=1 Tax=Thermoflexus sp. TaxID=1969742 RepID=UPI0035E4458D
MKCELIISVQRLFLRIFLIAGTLFAIGRLVSLSFQFGKESLQMDFAAFYTAGEALNNGLSPYVNYAIRNPPIWDGVSVFRHSRFLYPPLAAVLFQPIALLPYSVAKYLWTLLQLICVSSSLCLAIGMLRLKSELEQLLVLAFFASTFYPLFTLLERGQIDGVTLLLIVLATRLIVIENRNTNIIAGLLWALTTLLKLHCVYIVPFFIIRRKWAAIGGYIIGIFGILLISLLTKPNLLIEYSKNLPRIAQFGEGGDEGMRLPAHVIQALRTSLPAGYVQKDNIVYRYESFQFISNASIARSIAAALQRRGLNVQLSIVSVLAFLCFFVGIWMWQYRWLPQRLETFAAVLYWQSAWVIILLSAPLTWVMNTVWFLPIMIDILYILWKYNGNLLNKDWRLGVFVGIFGLVIAWMPDPILLAFLGSARLANTKYLLSGIFVLVSLLLMLEANLRITIGQDA